MTLDPRLAQRLEAIRLLQEMRPSEIPMGASDDEIARRLAYDTLAALSRASLVLELAQDAIERTTKEQIRANALKQREIEELRRSNDANEARELATQKDAAEARGLALRMVNGSLTWVGLVMLDQRMLAAVVSTAVTLIAAWVSGFLSL